MKACWIAIAVLVLLIAGAAVAGAVAVRHSGLSALPEPSSAEATIARGVRRFATPGQARARQNPVPLDAHVLAEGRAHFADHCASCHANDGSGATEIGRRLYPRAPDMRLPATQQLTDGELFYIIENGIRLTGMPGWGGGGNERGSWDLVHFIRHLPKLTREELLEMERLNPKAPDEWRELQQEDEFLGGEGPPSAPAHRHHP
jgi:mono/diheme cytochrome c family protein